MASSDLETYLSHRRALIDYVAPIVGCRSRAEDVVQEAFIRFSTRLRKADSGTEKHVQHPVAYLYRIVRNIALDWMRRADARVETTPLSDYENTYAVGITPEQNVIDRDQLYRLQQAMAELPERTQIAFYMRRVKGYKMQEIADYLGISVVRVHQLVKTALQHGAARLDDTE